MARAGDSEHQKTGCQASENGGDHRFAFRQIATGFRGMARGNGKDLGRIVTSGKGSAAALNFQAPLRFAARWLPHPVGSPAIGQVGAKMHRRRFVFFREVD